MQHGVTLDQDLARAVGLHQAAVRDRDKATLAEARVLYERILVATPRQADALQFLGVLRHHQGDTDEAVALIRRAIAEQPKRSDFHNNLGNVLKEANRLEEAALEYQAALELSPGSADAYSNLGAVWSTLGDTHEAARSYERALAVDPNHVGAHHNLANALQGMGRFDDAIGHYERALVLDPKLHTARQSLGQALHQVGRTEDAIAVFRAWLAEKPDDPVAHHLLAAISGSSTPARASDEYVTRAFDGLASTFDEHLKHLGYRAPQLVATALENTLDAGATTLDVLDAGCGTGLCAEFLRPRARRLVGVDLSSGMLQRARVLGAYDALLHAELTQCLENSVDAYDLVVSADTLCYFGDLAPVMRAVSRALRAGGIFVYTVEMAVISNPVDFVLNPNARYAHTEAYVRSVSKTSALDIVALNSDVLRMERGKPVMGYIVVCKKS